MILEVDNLTFGYHGTRVLEDICFSIRKGSVTAILGPNGVGKTTLIKCLNRILTPWKGKVAVKKIDISGMSIKDIAKRISYVAQKNDAPKMTVFDAVLMGRFPHTKYMAGKKDLEKVAAVMKKLNLSSMGLKHLDRLSGGELQKVAIARALVQETDLLLLDEPTSSLDLRNQTQILELIRHIVHGHNIAAVMTMHDLNSALRYADYYICLKGKSIFDSGRISEITPETISDVYGVKVDIINHKGYPVVVPAADGIAA